MSDHLYLTVDIGGSGIKSMVLNAQRQIVSERIRTKTPSEPTPDKVLPIIADQAQRHGNFTRVSVGFPGVVKLGVVYTAVNLDPAWVPYPLSKELETLLGKPVRVCNDADVQGYGAVRGEGLEMVVTLGTGIGGALFINGTLVPNLELGHLPFRKGQTFEEQLGAASLEAVGADRWNNRLSKAIALWQKIFNFDHLYLGGGNTDKVKITLPAGTTIVPNAAGLWGGVYLWKDAGL